MLFEYITFLLCEQQFVFRLALIDFSICQAFVYLPSNSKAAGIIAGGRINYHYILFFLNIPAATNSIPAAPSAITGSHC